MGACAELGRAPVHTLVQVSPAFLGVADPPGWCFSHQKAGAEYAGGKGAEPGRQQNYSCHPKIVPATWFCKNEVTSHHSG